MICDMKYANLYNYNLKYYRELILWNNQYKSFTTVIESSLCSFVQYF